MSSVKSWEEDLNNFFSSNHSQLLQIYPGLNLSRLHHLIAELNPFADFTSEDLTHLKQQLLSRIPLEYISGLAYFYKSFFRVDSRVLIPRSESEILVEMVVAHLQKNTQVSSILEVGVGSGALLLSVLGEMNRPITAIGTDISFAALAVAQNNYQLKLKHIHPQTNVEFFWADRLNGFLQKFDCIISNPPYIKLSDESLVHQQVKEFEPHQALFLPDVDYHEWFDVFFKQVSQALNPQGLFIMEGHENHLNDLRQLLSNKDFTEIEVINDYSNRPRFLKAKRKNNNG